MRGKIFNGTRTNPRRSLNPDIDRALASVPERVRDAALVVHKHLRSLGIPHALVGGLAVAAHGFERATQDVDFVLGDDAFNGNLVKYLKHPLPDHVGTVAIDYLTTDVSPGFDQAVAVSVEHPDRLVVAPLGVIVVAKLTANRPKDRADIAGLIEAGHSVQSMQDAVRTYAPDLMPVLNRILAP